MFVAAKMVALAQVRSDRFDSKSVVDFFVRLFVLTGYKQCLESVGFRTNPLQQPRVSEAWDRPYVRILVVIIFLSTISFNFRKNTEKQLLISLKSVLKLCCILVYFLTP